MATELVCFSHLRWDFVFQRPNHLMTRAAEHRRVHYVEEARWDPVAAADGLRVVERHRVQVVTPILAGVCSTREDADARVARLLAQRFRSQRVDRPIHWLQTPMALPISDALPRGPVVYDSMDDLSAFSGAPRALAELEGRLLGIADLVTAGGVSLQARVADRRPDALCLPSCVDLAHFRKALRATEPADMLDLPRPRFGYVGVIDERMDMALVDALAAANPSGSVILIGPVAKIDDASIPDRPNIHRLGPRPYERLPAYLGSWDVGILPFARGRATRYLSPTKTPEYLAAGLPVASTGIEDVRSPYGRLGLVEIGDGPDGFVAACRRALATDLSVHRPFARDFLAPRSWDATWATIDLHLRRLEDRARPIPATTPSVTHDRPQPAGAPLGAAAAGARTSEAVVG